jgi:hypothetical protein
MEYLHTLPLSERYFSSLHIVQTGSGAHPAFFYTMDTLELSLGVKRQQREANHSLSSGAEARK